jgi:uncharacterized protein YPO0396
MKQPIANIVLKLDKIGATVALKNVTPAEVMLLCAMHNGNAGGDPIVKLQEIPFEDSDKALKALEKQLTEVETILEELDEVENITEEVREKRASTQTQKAESLRERIAAQQSVMRIRNLNAREERNRLGTKYNQIVVNKFYPGNMPTVPDKFPTGEAEKAEWLQATLNSGQHDHFIVGASALQG